jgi:hypothetical protein
MLGVQETLGGIARKKGQTGLRVSQDLRTAYNMLSILGSVKPKSIVARVIVIRSRGIFAPEMSYWLGDHAAPFNPVDIFVSQIAWLRFFVFE